MAFLTQLSSFLLYWLCTMMALLTGFLFWWEDVANVQWPSSWQVAFMMMNTFVVHHFQKKGMPCNAMQCNAIKIFYNIKQGSCWLFFMWLPPSILSMLFLFLTTPLWLLDAYFTKQPASSIKEQSTNLAMFKHFLAMWLFCKVWMIDC